MCGDKPIRTLRIWQRLMLACVTVFAALSSYGGAHCGVDCPDRAPIVREHWLLGPPSDLQPGEERSLRLATDEDVVAVTITTRGFADVTITPCGGGVSVRSGGADLFEAQLTPARCYNIAVTYKDSELDPELVMVSDHGEPIDGGHGVGLHGQLCPKGRIWQWR